MKDICEVINGDIFMADTQVEKAKNIISTQLNSLEYLQDFGPDIVYFLQNGILFQNASFQSYLVQVLANNGINVSTLGVEISDLYQGYNFQLAAENNTTGLIAR